MTHRPFPLRPMTAALALLLASVSLHAFAQTQNTTYSYQYDAVGNRTQITDPLGRITQQSYDALNRLALLIDPDNGATGYGYDGLDQLTTVTDPRSLVTRYTTDGLGNQSALTSPDTGSANKTYDAAGNVVTSTDAKGQVTRTQYDALNRLTTITYADGKTIAYGYDQGVNGIGRLTHISDASGAIDYRYDGHGRLTADTRTLGNVAYATTYSYDSAGRLAGLTYPSGRIVTYTRDGLGRIAAITVSKDNLTQQLVSQVTYYPFGGVQSYINGVGKTVAKGMDLDGRITSSTLGNTTQVLGYDAASRISFISDANNPAHTTNYRYDNLDRLTQASGPSSSQGFGYDLTGNRTSQVIGANSYQAVISPNSNQMTQLTGPASNNGYQYDANGSRTNDASAQYGYDARGRMIAAATASGTTQYQINALGQRVQKSSVADTTLYHYDSAGRLIGESTAQGVFRKEYLYLNDMPVALFQ